MTEELLSVGSYVELGDGRRGYIIKKLNKQVGIELDDGTYLRRLRKNIKLAPKSDVPEAAGASDKDYEWRQEGAPESNYEANQQSTAIAISDSSESEAATVRAEAFPNQRRGMDTRYKFVDPLKNSFAVFLDGYRVHHFTLLLPGQGDELVTRTLAGKIFGDRLRRVDFAGMAPSRLFDLQAPQSIQQSGYRFLLLCKKVKSDRANFVGNLTRPELYYVITEGPGLETIDVEEELNKVADFGSISSASKTACRIELLFSPAKVNGIVEISCDEFVFTSGDTNVDTCSEGNCFAPPSFFEKLFEANVCKKAETTVQFRAIVENRVLKGTMTMKAGIGQIQFPPSVVKVDASNASIDSGINLIAVTKTFPSQKSRWMGQYLKGKLLPSTALNNLQKRTCPMFRDVLRDAGVPEQMLCRYDERKIAGRRERENEKRSRPRRSNRLKYRRNATKSAPAQKGVYFADHYFVGAADPTPRSIIPHGHVAIPGLPEDISSVLVTRAPAMFKSDILRLPVFRTSLLEDYNFGEIFFGNGSVPLPNLIADGDLDGDLYLVVWDRDIVESVPVANITTLLMEQSRSNQISKKRAKNPAKKSAKKGGSCRKGWFKQVQDAVSDVGVDVRIAKLISTLYNEAKAELERDSVYSDYIAYAKAYKASLDLKKHGDVVELPEHLWDALTGTKSLQKWKLGDFLVLPSMYQGPGEEGGESFLGKGGKLSLAERKGTAPVEDWRADPAIGLRVQVKYEEGLFEGMITKVGLGDEEGTFKILVQWDCDDPDDELIYPCPDGEIKIIDER